MSSGLVWAAEWKWINRLSLAERYDDNITQLSPKDLDRLQRQGGGTGFTCGSMSTATSGGRFSITTPDDFIAIPEISSSLDMNWLARLPTSLDLDFLDYDYHQNSIKTYQSYRVGISQAFPGGNGRTGGIQLSYLLTPSFYLRNLRSDRTAEELQVLPAPRREVTYRKQELQVRLEEDLVKDFLRIEGKTGRESRNYNDCFDERDSEMPFREAQVIWDLFGNSRIRLRASYRREDLHAGGDLADTPTLFEEDISSRRDIVSGDARFRWGKKGRRKSISLGYEEEKRDYSTTNPNDIFHFGRTDRRRYAALISRFELRKGWFLTAGAERQRNRSRFPSSLVSTIQPDETTDYDENLIQFGFGYELGLGAHSPQPRSPDDPTRDED